MQQRSKIIYQVNWKQSKIIEIRVWSGISVFSNLLKVKFKQSCSPRLFSSSFHYIVIIIRSLGGHDLIDVYKGQDRCQVFSEDNFSTHHYVRMINLMHCTTFCIIWPTEATVQMILIFSRHFIVRNSFICMKWGEDNLGGIFL